MEDSNSYKLKGELEISNNDDIYNYDIEVSHKDNKYYKVVMENKSNSYVQVILKNDDGVYIVTPSLNKSFKFQSEWPYDNSQIYLYDSLIKDIENDNERYIAERLNGVESLDDYLTKYGYVDKKGKVVIEPQYENAKSFSHGLAGVCVNGKWGFIDKTGTLVIDTLFDDVGYMSKNGVCPVKTSMKQADQIIIEWKFLSLELGITEGVK